MRNFRVVVSMLGGQLVLEIKTKKVGKAAIIVEVKRIVIKTKYHPRQLHLPRP